MKQIKKCNKFLQCGKSIVSLCIKGSGVGWGGENKSYTAVLYCTRFINKINEGLREVLGNKGTKENIMGNKRIWTWLLRNCCVVQLTTLTLSTTPLATQHHSFYSYKFCFTTVFRQLLTTENSVCPLKARAQTSTIHNFRPCKKESQG